jgi:hypothetical protein
MDADDGIVSKLLDFPLKASRIVPEGKGVLVPLSEPGAKRLTSVQGEDLPGAWLNMQEGVQRRSGIQEND